MIDSQVIVAGGGPVGTFLAFCLAEKGIDTVLLESASIGQISALVRSDIR